MYEFDDLTTDPETEADPWGAADRAEADATAPIDDAERAFLAALMAT